MKAMIRGHADMWYREEDLSADIPGRPDSQLLIAECVKYLRGWRAERDAGVTGVDEKARNALVHAKVQGAFAHPLIGQFREQVKQRDDRIHQQDATISRLLAFVPPKAEAIGEARLTEIVHEVGRAATALFKDHAVLLTLTEEDDSESLACHRLTVSALVAENVDVASLVAAEMKLREHFVSYVTDKELRALRLVVEYETRSDL